VQLAQATCPRAHPHIWGPNQIAPFCHVQIGKIWHDARKIIAMAIYTSTGPSTNPCCLGSAGLPQATQRSTPIPTSCCLPSRQEKQRTATWARKIYLAHDISLIGSGMLIICGCTRGQVACASCTRPFPTRKGR